MKTKHAAVAWLVWVFSGAALAGNLVERSYPIALTPNADDPTLLTYDLPYVNVAAGSSILAHYDFHLTQSADLSINFTSAGTLTTRRELLDGSYVMQTTLNVLDFSSFVLEGPEAGGGQGSITHGQNSTASALFLALPAGDYALTIAGDALGTRSVAYSASFTATPLPAVPEPDGWMLAIAGVGVGLIGGTRGRRQAPHH